MNFLTLPGLLSKDDVARLRVVAGKLTFVDGRVSSNPGSKVKNNLQGDTKDPLYAEAGQIVQQAIFRSEKIRDYALPKNIALPMLTKYQPGMEYGTHVDACILATNPPLRADVSCTVFLSDPSSYEGGELSAKLGSGEVNFKLPAGDAVFYPSVTLHRVTPVTKGERLVAITFLESNVRDHYRRQLLFELKEGIHQASAKVGFDTLTHLTNVHTNLYRLWCDK
jgi:PKHD-type hydroxylase